VPRITSNFLFNNQAGDAAEFYIRIFPNSKITGQDYYGEGSPLPAGTVLASNFLLDGQEFTAINCGQTFEFNESLSFRVVCHGQEEVDYYWNALTEGGSEGQCGWLKDKFGVSWQVTPVEMGEYLGNSDPRKAGRAMQAMMKMKKIDLAVFQAAIEAE
jgi:two-component system sensor histidine kinase QseC